MSFLQNRKREDRPWGSFDQFTQNENTTVKLVRVMPGKRLSYQYHHHRSEFWHVISGEGIVRIGDTETNARVGDEFEIPPETNHRLTAGENGLLVLEIALGDFDEKDIVRLEDDFARTDPTRIDS